MTLQCIPLTEVNSADCRMNFVNAAGAIIFQFDLERTTYTTAGGGVQVRDGISRLHLTYENVVDLGYTPETLTAKIDADRLSTCCQYTC